MVAVDDAPEVRYHRARKAWPCAGRRGDDCQGEIGAGDQYAEVRHAGLSERSFGKRFCLACAGALAPSSNGSTASAAAAPTTRLNGVARPTARPKPLAAAPVKAQPVEKDPVETGPVEPVEVGLRSVVVRPEETGDSVRHVVRLVVLWVLAVALSAGLLYASLRILDWFIQIMQQPMRPGGPA